MHSTHGKLRRYLLACAAFLASVIAMPSPAAQYPKQPKRGPGSLHGAVISDKGTPVAGAKILWQSADGSTPHVVRSDAGGNFQIAPMRAGIYELRASSGGAQSEWSHDVVVHWNAATNITLRLEVPRTAHPHDSAK